MSDLHPFLAELLAQGPVVTDGAWGTQLQMLGLPPGSLPDTWNVLQPGRVESVARSYVEAGSRVVLTNTFGSNRIRVREQAPEWADRVGELNRAGVEHSRQAAGGRAKVFASVGPTGKLLMSGEVTEDEVLAGFEEQTRALAEAGADALIIETMTDLEEARLALRAARATGLAVMVSMVFDSGKEKDRTMMGVSPDQAVEALGSAGASGFGANCGRGISDFAPLCRRMRAVTDLPLWMKANAGLPRWVDGRAVYGITPEQFGAAVGPLLVAGADFVGGCCGTGPDYIRAVAKAVEEWTKSSEFSTRGTLNREIHSK